MSSIRMRLQSCDGCAGCVPMKPWELPFLAEPREIAGLRRVMRLHLGLWGLAHLVDAAQLCVSELVSNVIAHVGQEVPTSLLISMRDAFLRIEVRDPDGGTLPTLDQERADPEAGEESGRGLLLVSALSSRWGVERLPDGKAVWCELDAALPAGQTALTCNGLSAAASA
ncbi:ATP-binding protein [Streptomyces sp. CO7]